MSLVQIPGTNMYRDTDTMALINKDQSGLNDYMSRRKFLSFQKDEINSIKSDVDTLKTDIQDIKQLLLKLLEKE